MELVNEGLISKIREFVTRCWVQSFRNLRDPSSRRLETSRFRRRVLSG